MKVFHHDKPLDYFEYSEGCRRLPANQFTVNVRKLTAGCVNFALRLNSRKVLAGFYLLRERRMLLCSAERVQVGLEKLLGENIVADDVEFELKTHGI